MKKYLYEGTLTLHFTMESDWNMEETEANLELGNLLDEFKYKLSLLDGGAVELDCCHPEVKIKSQYDNEE